MPPSHRRSPPVRSAKVERLNKVLARAGLTSRRGADRMIEEGRVSVNGQVVRELGSKVDPVSDAIKVDGRRLPVAPARHTYLLLYKPRGYVTTLADPEGRPSIRELLRGITTRVYPVGRLDVESEGLLLLTNDGDLTERLTHPRFGIVKTYLVDVEGSVGTKALRLLTDGVKLDDGLAQATSVSLVRSSKTGTLLEISLGEGRNREIRRMMEAIGHPVRRLVRTAIGPLVDRQLKPGAWRELSVVEVRSLYAAATEE